MTLWNVESPVRVLQRVRGLRAERRPATAARRRASRCSAAARASSSSRCSASRALPTRIRLDGELVAERAIPPETVWRPSVPAPAAADGTGRCVYELESDGLVGSTRIEFVRSA